MGCLDLPTLYRGLIEKVENLDVIPPSSNISGSMNRRQLVWEIGETLCLSLCLFYVALYLYHMDNPKSVCVFIFLYIPAPSLTPPLYVYMPIHACLFVFLSAMFILDVYAHRRSKVPW